MALITHFEDIQAWQEARKLVKMIYKLTNSGMLAKILGFVIKSSVLLYHPWPTSQRGSIVNLKQNLDVS